MCEFLALTVLTGFLEWFLERAWGKLPEKRLSFSQGKFTTSDLTGEFHVKFHLKTDIDSCDTTGFSREI